jgi:hypothetical protein
VTRRRAVVVVLDGTRRDMVTEADMPHVSALARRAEWCAAHRSVFPSATRVVSAAFATGCFPGRNELQGNSQALLEAGRLVHHDAGHPEFLQHKRRLTGRSLAVPTMAERLAPVGGAIIFNNVSPGAAYAHDPDGHGHVYHRAGSYGPGRHRLEGAAALDVSLDIAGDERMTTRFIDEVLVERKPALAMIWMGEPDTTQHACPLGSPEHRALLRRADANAQRVVAAVERLRAKGEDILLVVCSDHGHQTVDGVVDVDGALIEAGLKASRSSADIVTASNGTSVFVHVAEVMAPRLGEIGAFLASCDWAGRVLSASELPSVGQAARHGLAFAVAMRASEDVNPFGIPGLSKEALPVPGKAAHLHCGQHGGLARYEQAPFLVLDGGGFGTGTTRASETRIVDLAPTILTHLGQPAGGMDGRALQAVERAA